MVNQPVQIHETELGNRYVLHEGVTVDYAREVAQKVLTTAERSNLVARIRNRLNSYILERSVDVYSGHYDDADVTFAQATGTHLAELVLNGTQSE